jgi:carbonic anhydrase
MAGSRLDISNAAISIFLHDVAKFYDRARGFAAFQPTADQVAEVTKYFSSECCYCGESLNTENVMWDHLIPVDKRTLGLHAWGNCVPCCEACHAGRQQKPWREFLKMKCEKINYQERLSLIEHFAADKKYDLNLNLHVHADTLYEDIGAIAVTLIQLRYKQAEQKIRAVLTGEGRH